MCGRRKQKELLQGNFSSYKGRILEALRAKAEIETAKAQLELKKKKSNY